MRPTLDPAHTSPRVQELQGSFHRATVEEVAATVSRDRIVVVGMRQNPVVKKARALLDRKGLAYTYLEYGSYFSGWKQRLAIKLWAGFPTYPMVFLDGVLQGGCSELEALDAAGQLGG